MSDAHPSRADLARRLQALHEAPGAFVIPNPWDRGSARMLAALGFEALATTSAGYAHAVGLKDGQPGRDGVLENAREIIEAAPGVPVSADLENGFGPDPKDAAITIERAADVGLAGGSIEDATGDPSKPIYEFNHAVERVAAAVEAARGKAAPFVLIARAENFLRGVNDLDDTIRRLQAFEKAGADMLYAPYLPDLEAMRTICASVSKPVNVLAAGPLAKYSVAELSEAGASRISLGSGLSNIALGAFVRAAREMKERGTFGSLDGAIATSEVHRLLDGR
ncbi:MAG TPA: isocitrate lyase/phosphoenolpyruvate mutase family protein [Caulobacteraceae bacterium]|jgi:2-methylisocitrate lyase-like PEP mutase family enzyme|nr:isocitrate lyase/phosphoenolpyruvate mutase family protein [Caulobacteraceae bacterium]